MGITSHERCRRHHWANDNRALNVTFSASCLEPESCEIVRAVAVEPLAALRVTCQRARRILRATVRSRRVSFNDVQAAGLKAVKAAEDISESEQIRQAISDWLRKKGVKKSERKRVVGRKRP
jgi:hypothetical protein